MRELILENLKKLFKSKAKIWIRIPAIRVCESLCGFGSCTIYERVWFQFEEPAISDKGVCNNRNSADARIVAE